MIAQCLLCAAALWGCQSPVDVAWLEGELATRVGTRVAFEVDTVQCPKKIARDDKKPFKCKVVGAQGDVVEVEVRLLDPHTMRWRLLRAELNLSGGREAEPSLDATK